MGLFCPTNPGLELRAFLPEPASLSCSGFVCERGLGACISALYPVGWGTELAPPVPGSGAFPERHRMPGSALGTEGTLQGPAAHWGVWSEQAVVMLGGLQPWRVLRAGCSPARLGEGLSGGFWESQKPEVSRKRSNGSGAGKEVETVFQAGWCSRQDGTPAEAWRYVSAVTHTPSPRVPVWGCPNHPHCALCAGG